MVFFSLELPLSGWPRVPPHSVGCPRLPDETRAAPRAAICGRLPGAASLPLGRAYGRAIRRWRGGGASGSALPPRRCRSAVRCRRARPGGAACRELRRPRPRSQRAEPGWRAVRAGAGLSSARGGCGARPGARGGGGGWRSAAPGDPPRHADPAAPAARRGE